MHEMSMVKEIVKLVLDECSGTDIVKVKSVHLTIGELRDVIFEYIPDLFRFLARDTIAAEAQVDMEKVPALLACGQCGTEFHPADTRNPWGWRCPACNAGTGFNLRAGMEFMVDSIEVDEASD